MAQCSGVAVGNAGRGTRTRGARDDLREHQAREGPVRAVGGVRIARQPDAITARRRELEERETVWVRGEETLHHGVARGEAHRVRRRRPRTACGCVVGRGGGALCARRGTERGAHHEEGGEAQTRGHRGAATTGKIVSFACLI